MGKEQTQFKKGVSGNPGGRPPTPAEIRIAKELTKTEFARIASRYLMMDEKIMALSIANPNAPMLEKILGKIIQEASETGCEKKAAFILDRIIGKPTESIELSGRNEDFDHIASQISRERLYMLAQAHVAGATIEQIEEITKP